MICDKNKVFCEDNVDFIFSFAAQNPKKSHDMFLFINQLIDFIRHISGRATDYTQICIAGKIELVITNPSPWEATDYTHLCVAGKIVLVITNPQAPGRGAQLTLGQNATFFKQKVAFPLTENVRPFQAGAGAW